jgi:hypothetical protein
MLIVCAHFHVQLVFTEVALGAIILTVNVILLGGNIVFFQSLCLMGYCLFPIVLASIVCVFVKIAVSPWLMPAGMTVLYIGHSQRVTTVAALGAGSAAEVLHWLD